MSRIPRLVRLLCLLLACALAGATAHAREIPVQACIARIAPGGSAGEILRAEAALDCSKQQTRLGKGDFVARLKFSPQVSEPVDPLVLRLASVWQQSAAITFHYADGGTRLVRFASGDVSRFTTIGAIWEFVVPPRDAALEGITIETRGSANLRGVVMGPRLMNRSDSESAQHWLIGLYAGFAGLALALVTYNFSLWLAMRHGFQLRYCAMVAALAGYAFTSSGLAELAFPALDNNVRLRLNYALLALFAVSAIGFGRHFFEGRVLTPRVNRLASAAASLCLASSLAFVLLAPWRIGLLDQLYFGSIVLVLAAVSLMIYSAWRHRSRYLGIFLLAWSAPFATSVLRAMHGFNLIGYSFLLDNSNFIALAIEALLSSLMVTARLRELSDERDDAIAGERFARRLASTDPLTGLLNRRAFMDLAIGRRSRHRLLLLDVDHFKSVNDRFGHEVGDQVLERVATVIQQFRPARSLAVRLGGEEFGVLLPRSAFGECTPDALLAALRSAEMPQGARVTASIGFADGSVASEADWKRLYRLADAALYRAKADGRDRACRATDFRAAA